MGIAGPGPKFDLVTGAAVGIDYIHHEVHDGKVFQANVYDLDLDSTDTLISAFKIPDTSTRFHMVVYADCSLTGVFEFLRGPTITNGSGSDVVAYNHDENSSNVSEILNIEASPTAGRLTENPTVTADGVVIWSRALGAGKNQALASSRDEQEIILKNDTIYACRITSSLDNAVANIGMIWYEH